MVRAAQTTLLCILCVTGCSFLGGDDGIVAKVTTNQTSYLLTDTSGITMMLKNVLSSSIYYGTCDRTLIEEGKNGRQRRAVTVARPCHCLCIQEIKPGEQAEWYLASYWIMEKEDELKLTKEFEYRIFPVFYWDKEKTEQVSRSSITANRIQIQVQ